MTAVIEVEHVTFGYRPADPVLQDISFPVRAGTFLAVAGPNGAGKSTLLNILAGLLRPQSGEVLLEGVSLWAYRVQDIARRIAVVRQEFIPVFGFSVAETVLMARTPYFGRSGFESKADRELAARALDLTDTTRFASRPLGSLSAGERQRVFIARALAQDTPVLLLDEPTSFLDLRHQVGIYDLLKSIQLERRTTVVAVTHDINLAMQYCEEALLLYPPDGPPAEHARYRLGKTSEVFTPEEIERAFAVRIFAGDAGSGRFLMPLGTRARDSNPAPARRDGPCGR
jgi:iron complex transport system ATP-binding protein